MESIPEILRINPAYKSNGEKVLVNNRFVVHFSIPVAMSKIETLNTKYKITTKRIRGKESNIYLFETTDGTPFSVLKMANLYYDNFSCISSKPDFMVSIRTWSTPTDAYYIRQYYLKTDQINAEDSWDISTGSSDIITAVIDQGGSAHNELAGRLIILDGSDIYDFDDDPTPHLNMAHGMAIAGIIAAGHNNGGIAGIAPNSKIVPIRVFGDHEYDDTSLDDFAAAVEYAYAYANADILNLSWGIDTNDPNNIIFDDIRDAVNDALSYGRKGKGSIVVSAAGNNTDHGVSFPASMNGVIAVGAVKHNGTIWDYSPQWDTKIDVVAPSGGVGVFISSQACPSMTES